MPVEDHPVHAKTAKGRGHIYEACQNKPRRAPENFVMSVLCRYDLSDIDPGCKGCTYPKDLEYIAKIKAST